jgi:cysteine desulfurase/selenocysteine lyase
VANPDKSLESRFMEMAQDLAQEAQRVMAPESYGQWADAPYQLMAAAGATQGKTQSVPALSGVLEAEDAGGTVLNYFMRDAELALQAGNGEGKRAYDVGRVQGFDVLDPHFLSGLANDVFNEAAQFAPDISERANTGITTQDGKQPANEAYPYFLTASSRSPTSASAKGGFDVHGIRRDFPILQRKVHGKPLIWLDNGATTQKPQAVIDRLVRFYEHENSNVHRGAHTLAAEATDAYEGARSKVAAFLGAALPEEIVFVRGTTEGINLIANAVSEKRLGPGDEILLTEAEHHANIVPWQFVAQKTGALIRVVPVNDNGEITLDEFGRRLGPRTKIVSMTHVSNALGSVMPIHDMTRMAKAYGAIVVIDGAQGVPHRKVDVCDIGCDFYVFSGHKLFAPTGIGAVYGRKHLWEELGPWQGGGSMITKVTFEKSSFADPPNKFEAGTGSLASAVGLGAAIDYVESIGLDAIERYETELVEYAVNEIRRVKGVRIIGTPKDRAGVISFVLEGRPVREVGTLLDAEGIAVRAGHHCAQPILARYGLDATIRPAFAFYNTKAEADALVAALHKIGFRR